VRFRVAGADQSDRAGMAKDLPETFGALDRSFWTGALERLARHQTVIGQVDRQCDKLSDFSHRLAFLVASKTTLISAFLFDQDQVLLGSLRQINGARQQDLPLCQWLASSRES
jgi:hypothetical protein